MSILKKDNFDYLSDELFEDDDENLNKSNSDDNTQQSQDLSFSSQRFEDRRMLYESFMADPTIPTSQKNAMGFWKSLYQPTYSTQKIFKLLEQRNLIGSFDAPIMKRKSKVKRRHMLNEDYGYDGTFFAPTKVLLEEQRRREDIPKAIKDIYEQKGIVNASQIYKIEQKLNCDSDESDVEMKPSTSGINQAPVDTVSKELNQSLLELSRTVSEQYEISQIMKDIQNISDLDASLTELTEKIQYSSKAEQLVNHTISCSQRLKILDDIYTSNIEINTCDVMFDEELKKSSQESNCDILGDLFKSPVIPNKIDINDNFPGNFIQNNNENIPKEVKFSFASGKTINVSSKSVMKFKTIFDNEEKKIESEENLELVKNPTILQSDKTPQQQNNGTASKNVGFVFASGKSALISTSKLHAFEQKFKEEEAKLKKLEGEPSIELITQNYKDNKENDGNAHNSPKKPFKKSSQETFKSKNNDELHQNSRTSQRIRAESSALRRIKSKSLLGLKPKRVRFDESVIDKNTETTNANIEPEIPEKQEEFRLPVPMQVGFSFASGKNIKISDASVTKFKNIFETEERNMELLKNVKEPQQVGFSFASGKNIKINSTSMAKFKNIFETEERNMELLESSGVSIPKQQNAPNQNIDRTKLLNFEKRFMEEEEKLKKIDELKVLKSSNVSKYEVSIGNKSNSIKITAKVTEITSTSIGSSNKAIENKNLSTKESVQQNVRNQNVGFVFASGKSANIDRTMLLNFEKKFMDEEEKLKKIDELKVPKSSNVSKNEVSIGNKANSIKIPAKVTEITSTSIGSFNKITRSKNPSHKTPEKATRSDDPSTGFPEMSSGKKKYFKIKEAAAGSKCISSVILQKTTASKCIESKNKATESNNNSNESKEVASGNRSNSTGSQRKLFETLSNENQEKSKNEFNSIKNDNNSQNSDSDGDISLASQYRLTMNVYQSSSEDEKFNSRNANSRSKKLKSALMRNLKKPNFGKKSNLNDSMLNVSRPAESTKISQNNDKKQNQIKSFEVQPSISKCDFVLASGKSVDLNQSKKSAAKRNFADDVDENDISIPCQSSDKSQASKASNKEQDTQSSSKSSFKAGNSSINFNSHRLNSLRAKRKHEDDSDIFNFDLSTHSIKSKKPSQASATPVNKILDSGIESQDKLVNKVESPQPFKKSAFFTPMFTSSPVLNSSTAKSRIKFTRFNDRKPDAMTVNPFEEIKKTFMPDKKIDKKEEEIDKVFGELVVFKPSAPKRLAVDRDDEIMISPIVREKKRQRRSYDTPNVSKNLGMSDIYRHQTLGQRIAEIDEFMDLQSQLRIIGNDPTESQVVSILEIEQQHLTRFETENRVKIERKEGIKEQMEYVNNKPEDESRQMTGTMFMMKCGSRRNLKDYLENERPRDKNVHELTFNSLLEFKFDMKNYVDEAWSKVSVIVADNAKLILDETSNVGFNEILYSFLASYGVDPKLVSHEWVENAYKMILMKFIWMENSFDKIDKFEVLTPEYVLLQLKYRYDREIDRHQRPAIRKITERDEVSNRRVVLKVIDIIYSLNVGYELELSDGWYKMRTCVDSCLAEAISRKKIAINTKLILCNSELINMFTSAYHPLEVPKGVRLKIHGNSARIASYETKLGFCKKPQSFLISVDSISSDGGAIGRLKLFITHVYTIVYVESMGERKEFRSEKMQNRLENKKEILYSAIFEKIQKQVMQENYNELKERVGKIDRSKIVLSKMSIHEICDILEYENESDLSYAIKSQLAYKQIEKIQEIHHQRKFELNQKIKERINQNENNVAQLLKFRVVDANKPKKTALVSWWQPSEELLDIIKQGNMIELFKTTSAGKFQAMCGGEIQIHADKSTVVKLLKTNTDKAKFDKFIRRETKFEDITNVFSPLNNEFDVACMIVHVDEKLNDGKLQRVFVADERLNLMSLNFYPSLNEYAYDDVLIEGKILYIRNLQWRKMFKHNNFPEAHTIIDSTIFISNPKDEGQKKRLEEFASRIKDTGSYIQRCLEKLESFIGKIPQKSNSKIVDLSLNFETPSPLVTNRKRVLGMKRIPQKYRFS